MSEVNQENVDAYVSDVRNRLANHASRMGRSDYVIDALVTQLDEARAELAKVKAVNDNWLSACQQTRDERDALRAAIEACTGEMGCQAYKLLPPAAAAPEAGLRSNYSGAVKLVNEQAEDDGLWFNPQYATEAYLQQALRKLHAAIEGDSPVAPPPAQPATPYREMGQFVTPHGGRQVVAPAASEPKPECDRCDMLTELIELHNIKCKQHGPTIAGVPDYYWMIRVPSDEAMRASLQPSPAQPEGT